MTLCDSVSAKALFYKEFSAVEAHGIADVFRTTRGFLGSYDKNDC